MTPRALPSQEYLLECFEYDARTGVLKWKSRPRRHFRTSGGWKVFNTRYAGEPALTCVSSKGYLHGKLTTLEAGRMDVSQHRVIWKLVTGDEPPELLDHEDTNTLNNRMGNLRMADRSENMANTGLRSDNTTGVKGVGLFRNKYRARVRHQGTSHYLGAYDTPELASAAYAAKAQELFGEFART